MTVRPLRTITKLICAALLTLAITASTVAPAGAAAFSQSEEQCRTTRPSLRPGDTGTCVRALQRALANKGVFNLTSRTEAKFGPLTQSAVNRFQSQSGLPQGTVGPRTWAALLGNSSAKSQMRPGVPAAQSGSTAGIPAACQNKSGKRICIKKTDATNAKVWALENGKLKYGPYDARTGRAGYTTPLGTKPVSFKNKDHVSSIYDAEMPNAVFFNGGIAIHQGSLKSASHGCVRVSMAASENLFNFAVPGSTLVTVTK